VTECMEERCNSTATHYKKTEGFSYDSYKCEEHASNGYVEIEDADKSIQLLHEKSKDGGDTQ